MLKKLNIYAKSSKGSARKWPAAAPATAAAAEPAAKKPKLKSLQKRPAAATDKDINEKVPDVDDQDEEEEEASEDQKEGSPTRDIDGEELDDEDQADDAAADEDEGDADEPAGTATIVKKTTRIQMKRPAAALPAMSQLAKYLSSGPPDVLGDRDVSI